MRPIGILCGVVLLTFSCAEAPAGESLRTERDQAVRAGVRWVAAFLADPNQAAPLGVDAVGILSGYAASAEDEESREIAMTAARSQGSFLATLFLAEERLSPGVILDLLYLLTENHELGLDTTALEAMARQQIGMLPSPDSVYGEADLDPDVLERLSAPRFLGLVLGVYAVERAAAYGFDFGIEFGLEEFVQVMRSRPLREDDRDELDNATHMAYLFSEYGRLLRTESDIPDAFAYVERALPKCLAIRHIDTVGEIIDIWRNVGRDETNSEAFRTGTLFLLDAQNPDGSWGRVDPRAPYAATHPTWCAIMALGERRFKSDTPYERRLRDVLLKHP